MRMMTVTYSLPTDMVEQIDRVAKAKEVSKSNICRKAIRAGLEVLGEPMPEEVKEKEVA